MYDLHLTPEQLEFRDAVRDFVSREVKPAATDSARLEPFEKPLLSALLDEAAQMGLRTLGLSEESGGAGADTLTTCMLLEELAVGDVDIAVVLGETALLACQVFGGAMNDGQRERWLPRFLKEDQFHLALIARDAQAGQGWNYHQTLPLDAEASDVPELTATRDGAGWVINGTAPVVSNAPVAQLFIVQAKITGSAAGGVVTLLVSRDAKGVKVGAPLPEFGADGEFTRWHHGAVAAVGFADCRVADEDVIAADAAHRDLHEGRAARHAVQMAAINVGVARAAYEAAVDYAKMRWQGGRHIVEHQAIGMKLADITIQLEASRSLVWKAAWLADHPGAIGDRSVTDLPWPVIARTFTAESLHRATLEAAECFGAMGVMRDMPLQKYVHDTLVLRHSADCDLATPLAVAEVVAGFQRAPAA